MPARRVTTVTVPVQVRSGVAFEAYRDRTPLLTIWATRPALLVTLTLPERIEPGHVRFARQLATSAAAYAVEVERRGLGGMERKGYICDGQKYNWSIYEMHLQPSGFVAILDFIHLLGYLYGAAQAAQGKGTEAAWQCYERWLREAWSGRVPALREALRAASTRCRIVSEDSADRAPARSL